MKKIIITGGTGFIGRNLVKRLSNTKKFSIVLVANTSSLSEMEMPENADLKFYTTDIRNRENILRVFQDERADVCIHLAAKISVIDSIKKPDETMDINVNGTENVLEACNRSGVDDFVFASSAAVYGDVKRLPISEDESLRPLSPYGKSKMLAEQHVLSYNKSRKIKNAICLRIFNAYGSGQTTESDVITKFANRLSSGKAPVISGDGKQTRDFISVEDIVDAFILSTAVIEDESKLMPQLPVFNVGTGKPTSINELVQKMIKIFGADLQPIYREKKQDEKEILASYANITTAKKTLNFVAKKSIETGLRELIEPIVLRKNSL